MSLPTNAHQSRFRAGLLLLAVLLAALAVACGGGTTVEPEPDPDPGAQAEAGVVSTPPEGATQVSVSLKEWSVTPETSSVPAGEAYFLAANDGGEAHELVVIKTELAPEDLPVGDDGGVSEDEVDMIGEIEPFAAGSQASAVFDLEPGSYALICNIVETEESGKVESHYQEGMRTAFTVE
jgi:hypothetical protein